MVHGLVPPNGGPTAALSHTYRAMVCIPGSPVAPPRAKGRGPRLMAAGARSPARDVPILVACCSSPRPPSSFAFLSSRPVEPPGRLDLCPVRQNGLSDQITFVHDRNTRIVMGEPRNSPGMSASACRKEGLRSQSARRTALMAPPNRRCCGQGRVGRCPRMRAGGPFGCGEAVGLGTQRGTNTSRGKAGAIGRRWRAPYWRDARQDPKRSLAWPVRSGSTVPAQERRRPSYLY